eukprot:6187658-Pleurochrysis_carterae.AAC.2
MCVAALPLYGYTIICAITRSISAIRLFRHHRGGWVSHRRPDPSDDQTNSRTVPAPRCDTADTLPPLQLVTIQRFYGAMLEPVFTAIVPILSALKTLLPQLITCFALVLGDLALATRFGVLAAVASSVWLMAACCAAMATIKLCRIIV